MKINIYDDRVTGSIKNFWNNIHFHPTDAIEDDWGRRILDKVSEDNVAQTVRMYAMLEDIVSMDESGNLQYDFTLNDQRIDYMIGKGFNILLSYNFIPPCIASDMNEVNTVCKNKTRYKGKFIVTSPPKDWSLWQEICRAYTAHIVDRYGEETVGKWYLQCFNEPDIGVFFARNACDTEERCRLYCRLYEGFEKGICSVSKKLCIGGPALAGVTEFFEQFIKTAREKEYRLDFICFHTYGTSVKLLNSNEKLFDVCNSLDIIDTIKSITDKYGFSETPLVIDEWGMSSQGYYDKDECKAFGCRDNEVFAVYFIKMITKYTELNIPVDKMMICLSGQHEMKKDFTGFRNFFTLNFYPKPIYNAYVLASKIGNKRLDFEGNDNNFLTVFPAKTDDGRTVIALTYSSTNFNVELEDIDITLEFSGGAEYKTARLWRIDKDHSNSYTAFIEKGSPDNPTMEEKEYIASKGMFEYEEVNLTDNRLDFKMCNNSVALIEL